ncbi:hypothetical protein VSS37_02380 [Candidatus Thiothrix sp. Deng01]|uniref:DNA2/NAM7 helicase helicase domain-containing protein n=1 Tax=Candidatus Thiothrix phosphatis TaxID=3112415 RepID=A0ABU6CSL3_9GAMM|nr:hypothetical protein [Candidatus Thiothrix sp. Deng01]MEB4589815.1 hypothetical protein [Candidatus Thiothrix sp. Deng01]
MGLPDAWIEAPEFAIRSYVYLKDPNPPEPLLLNSFFLDDLALAKQVFSMNQCKSLQQYLGITHPAERHDLLRDKVVLNTTVSPRLTPLARWPSNGNHPLVLLQQAAVNLSFQETKTSGMLGINGPPGTGKTTLLRDLVAGVVTQRAEELAKYDNPATAFEHSGQKLKVGNGWLHLYRLDESLRGFELLVASSNNKAVENVSAELPALKAISEDAIGLRYFTTLSDKLHQTETWGAIAAVLGNTKNRSQFKQDFWWDDDYGINSYLQAASGSMPQIEEEDPKTGKITYRPPHIVDAEKPPASPEEAVTRWKNARGRFLNALESSRKAQRWLETLRQEMIQLPTFAQRETEALARRDQLTVEVHHCEVEIFNTRKLHAKTSLQYQEAIQDLHNHQQVKPGFLARLFRTKAAMTWSESLTALQARNHQAETRHYNLTKTLAR